MSPLVIAGLLFAGLILLVGASVKLCGQKPTKPTSKRDADKNTLFTLLNDERYEFRTVRSMKKAIGTEDSNYVRELLAEIGTRKAYNKKYRYGLISRVGARASRQNSSY